MILIFHLSSSLDPASDAFGQVLGSMHCCTASPSQWFPSPAPSLCRSAGRAGPGFSSFLQLPSANAQHVTFLWSWKRQERRILYIFLWGYLLNHHMLFISQHSPHGYLNYQETDKWSGGGQSQEYTRWKWKSTTAHWTQNKVNSVWLIFIFTLLTSAF